LIEHLTIEGFLKARCSRQIFGTELNPDVAVRVLLDINALRLPKVSANAGNLLLNVNEEGRVLSEINLSCIKHALE